jgi:hypothetical protein
MTYFEQWEFESQVNPGLIDFCDPSGRRWWWDNYYWYAGSWWGPNPGGPPAGSEVETSDLEYYVQKAAASIASSGWDALTFLAEFHQMRRMFGGVVNRLRTLVRQGQSGFKGKRVLTLKRASELWLEGRYGWRILSYDIADLHDLLVTYRDKRTRYHQRYGHKMVNTFDTYNLGNWGEGEFSIAEQITVTTNLRSTVVADMEVPKVRFNPVVTAWEVTKFSFVLDWLVGVGQALDAADFLLRNKDYQACGGYRLEIESEGSIQLVTPEPGYTYHNYSGSYTGSGYFEKRIPLKVSSIPKLKLRLNRWKSLDLLSLVIQALN